MSGAAHRADDPDEVTRILQAGGPTAPAGDVQAMQVARPAEAAGERTTSPAHDAPDEDERTTILQSPPTGPGGPDAAPAHPDDATAPWSDVEAMQAARPADATEEHPAIPAHDAADEDERTTILQSPYAGPDRTGAAPDDPDGTTAPWSDVEAMQAARPPELAEEHPTVSAPDEDERTTILQSPSATPAATSATAADDASGAMAPWGDVQAMEWASPAAADEERTAPAVAALPDEDERTTILQSPRAALDGGDAARSAPDQPATPPDDPAGQEDRDPSTFGPVSDAKLGTADPPAHPPHSDADASPVWPGDTAGEDEATTILTSADAAEDERTTILRHPGLPASTWPSEALHAAPAEAAPIAVPPAAWAPAPEPQEATTILPAAEPQPGPADSTEILPAAALAGLPDSVDELDGQVSGRAWFDRRLRDFNHALLHKQNGQKRPAAERQALAAAARDMIQRVGLRDPEHKEADWAYTVLQADQLLVNTYFVRALIARGGVGEIYRARHRDLKTEHAIKILLPRYALDPTVLNLMLEEARLLQRVHHEAVVGCQGLLRDTDGRPMLVMDYLRGRTLSARLRDGPLPPAELIQLAARLASGLSAVHAQGLVHQDISPDNIILVDDNCAAATIIDFGLARSLDAPENTHRNIDFAGKFSWCSPEQLSSRATHVDARSDLYSLGLVLAAAARGSRLDMGHDLASARAARHAVPPLGGIQEPIATLLRHLLAPSTATRLRSAEEVPDWLRAKRPGLVQRWFGK